MKFHTHLGTLNRVRKSLSSLPTFFMAVPTVFLDICLEIYQHTAFRLLSVPLVPRSEHIRIDRHKLSYLTWYEKIFCAYCGYVNGVFAYATHIGARTEQYWCAVMHENKPGSPYRPPAHHQDFVPYDNEEAFNKEYERHKGRPRT